MVIGQNQSTMSNHVKFVAKEGVKISNQTKDYILDIASNDETLLNNYEKFITVGIDPLVNKYKNF